MRKFDDAARLGHIYDAICRIETYIRGIDKSAFAANGMMQDAIVRQWDTVQNDLPALKPMIEKLLGE